MITPGMAASLTPKSLERPVRPVRPTGASRRLRMPRVRVSVHVPRVFGRHA